MEISYKNVGTHYAPLVFWWLLENTKVLPYSVPAQTLSFLHGYFVQYFNTAIFVGTQRQLFFSK